MMMILLLAMMLVSIAEGSYTVARITLASGVNPTYMQLCVRDIGSTVASVEIGGQYAWPGDPDTAPSPTWFALQQASFDAACFFQGGDAPIAWFVPAPVRVTLAGGAVVDFAQGLPALTAGAEFDVTGAAASAGAPMPATPPLAEPADATARTSDGPFRAGATFFTAAVTACKITSSELTSAYADRYVAVNSADWDTGRQCGRCMRVSTADGASVTELVVIDQCPSDGGKCYNFNWLDVSPGAFAAIGTTSWGVMQVQWSFVDCAQPTVQAPGGADPDNLMLRFEHWSTGAGFELQVANVRTKLAAVRVHSLAADPSQLTAWTSLTPTDHNTWKLPAGSAALACPCHVALQSKTGTQWVEDPAWDSVTGAWGPFALSKDIAALPKWPTFLGTSVSLLTTGAQPTKAPTKAPSAATVPAQGTKPTKAPSAKSSSAAKDPQKDDDDDDDDETFSTGTIAFIAAGSGAVVLAIALGVCVWRRKKGGEATLRRGRKYEMAVAQPADRKGGLSAKASELSIK